MIITMLAIVVMLQVAFNIYLMQSIRQIKEAQQEIHVEATQPHPPYKEKRT